MTALEFLHLDQDTYGRVRPGLRVRWLRLLHRLGYEKEVERRLRWEAELRQQYNRWHPAPCQQCRRRLLAELLP